MISFQSNIIFILLDEEKVIIFYCVNIKVITIYTSTNIITIKI
jgi:hypothetical protein